MCVRGASALDRLLAEFPNAPISVYAIWEPVIRTDIAPPVTGVLSLLEDPRVKQYWDPMRIVSADMVRAVNADPPRYALEKALSPEFIAWDVVAVFGKDARWERDLPVPAHYGNPVVGAIGETRTAITDALKTAQTVRGRTP